MRARQRPLPADQLRAGTFHAGRAVTTCTMPGIHIRPFLHRSPAGWQPFAVRRDVDIPGLNLIRGRDTPKMKRPALRCPPRISRTAHRHDEQHKKKDKED